MELVRYLNEIFYDEQQLLAAANIDRGELDALQRRGVMPLPSYTLRFELVCNSFFGRHQAQSDTAYYAKDYVTWIDVVRKMPANQAFELFSRRYREQLKRLADAGMSSIHEKLNAGLNGHLESEWQYFLNGIYGLCTKSGLPEDIATKELAIVVIKEVTEERYDKPLSQTEHVRLAAAIDLLDCASTSFAPHEVSRSSRHRLIDQMRAAYAI